MCPELSYVRGRVTTPVRKTVPPSNSGRQFRRRSRMKATFTLIAVPLVMGVAFAQSSGSGSPAGSQSGSQPAAQSQSETKTQTKTESQSGTMATKTDTNSKPAELKTMKYKGTLVDLACGAASSNTASSST